MLIGGKSSALTAAVRVLSLKSIGYVCFINRIYVSRIDLPDSAIRVHRIAPNVLAKNALFGRFDATTFSWTDGVFTNLLRGEAAKSDATTSIIVFDGSIDPVWAENLNSVLDDTRLLTLSSGERIPLPAHVRIVFEVGQYVYSSIQSPSVFGVRLVASIGIVSVANATKTPL